MAWYIVLIMKFYIFHVSVVPVDSEAVFAHGEMTAGQKNQAIVDAMLNRAVGVYRRRKFRLYDVRQLGEDSNVIYGHIASPDKQEIAQPDDMDEDLIRKTVESHRWTHFVYLGEGKQYIAVMDKQEFFSGSIRGVARLLQELLVEGLDLLKYPGYTIEVEPKTDKRQFWDVIDSASRLYKVRFNLITPNAFGGAEKLQELLSQQRSKHNATRFVTEINNEKGELEISKDDPEIEAEVDYASRGGGHTKIVYGSKDGPPRRWSSDEARVTIEIRQDATADTISLKDQVFSILKRLRGLL